MAVKFTYVNPPIPYRNCDWSCSLTDDEDAVRGWGSTKEEALNDLLSIEDENVIAAHFGIQTREVDTLRGPEHGHWLAFTDTEHVEAPWRDLAIVELAYKLVEAEQ